MLAHSHRFRGEAETSGHIPDVEGRGEEHPQQLLIRIAEAGQRPTHLRAPLGVDQLDEGVDAAGRGDLGPHPLEGPSLAAPGPLVLKADVERSLERKGGQGVEVRDPTLPERLDDPAQRLLGHVLAGRGIPQAPSGEQPQPVAESSGKVRGQIRGVGLRLSALQRVGDGSLVTITGHR